MSGGTNMRLYYMGLTLFGACLVAHYCIKRIMERKERKELQQRYVAQVLELASESGCLHDYVKEKQHVLMLASHTHT